MAERSDIPPADGLPEAVPERSTWRWALLIWIVPIVAVLIGAWLAVRGILNQGPTVEISFKTASGLEEGKTKVRYKDVDVGTVRKIGLSEDRNSVIVTAQLTPEGRGMLNEDTKFWVVRPRITGGQALGLGTLLSGAYIALDPGKSRESRRAFVGLENPPVVTGDEPGRQFILRAEDLGSVDVGSPVYYRRVRVGQVVSAELDPDGKAVSFRLFVSSPYDRYVTQSTRFWNASGVDLSVDARGLRLETQSLASIVIGGVAFQALPEAPPSAPAPANATFDLFRDRESAFKAPATVTEKYLLYFTQSVRGLNVGSPVDFRGVTVGEVARISLEYHAESAYLQPAVEINVYPERIAAQFRTPQAPYDPAQRAQILQRFVDRGLRAQLRTGNLITAQLYITLDYFPKESKVRIDGRRSPLVLPTVPGGFEVLQASIEGLVKRLEQVPFEQLGGELRGAINTMDIALRNVNALVARLDTEIAPELRGTLEQARETLKKAEGVLSEDAPLQGDLRGTLRDVTRAAQSIRSLTDYLERHPESLLRGKPEERDR
jgi:paraquat-inducible protein B